MTSSFNADNALAAGSEVPATPPSPLPGSDPRPGSAEPTAPVIDPEHGVVVPVQLPPASDQPHEERL